VQLGVFHFEAISDTAYEGVLAEDIDKGVRACAVVDRTAGGRIMERARVMTGGMSGRDRIRGNHT